LSHSSPSSVPFEKDEKKNLFFPLFATMRISDKIQAAIDAKETFFSFEYFPPRTEEVRLSLEEIAMRSGNCQKGASISRPSRKDDRSRGASSARATSLPCLLPFFCFRTGTWRGTLSLGR